MKIFFFFGSGVSDLAEKNIEPVRLQDSSVSLIIKALQNIEVWRVNFWESNQLTVIFFTIYPFNEDYAIKYGFDILRKRGFNVVVLNVFEYLFDHRLMEYARQYGELKSVMGVEQIRVRSENDLQKCLDNIQGWKIGIPHFDPHVGNGRQFFKLIAKAKIDYITFNTGEHPTYSWGGLSPARFSHFLKRFFRNPVETINNQVFKKIKMRLAISCPYLFGYRHPKYHIAGTEVYPHKISLSETKIIRAHSFDYDRFLKNRERPKPAVIPDHEYYVFIASSPWGAHDYFLFDVHVAITKTEYAITINRFLDFIEAKTGRKIIIAAHPKFSSKENIYNNRPFLYDTEQLIKYSSGVICHYSGATKFAVIYEKPLCFVSLWKMNDDWHFQRMIRAYADAIQAPICYIDKNDSLSDMTRNGFFYYDSNAYKKFTRKYINPGNCVDRLLWDIVADTLSKDYAID